MGLFLGPHGSPRGGAFSYERGTPLAESRKLLCEALAKPRLQLPQQLAVQYHPGQRPESMFYLHGRARTGPGRAAGRDLLITSDRLRVGWLNGLWEGYHESRRCSGDTYPESYITKYPSIRRQSFEPLPTVTSWLVVGIWALRAPQEARL